MLQKKVCMVGAFATGKTSLVERFVKSIYSDIYQTTVGVKIDKKTVSLGKQEVNPVGYSRRRRISKSENVIFARFIRLPFGR